MKTMENITESTTTANTTSTSSSSISTSNENKKDDNGNNREDDIENIDNGDIADIGADVSKKKSIDTILSNGHLPNGPSSAGFCLDVQDEDDNQSTVSNCSDELDLDTFEEDSSSYSSSSDSSQASIVCRPSISSSPVCDSSLKEIYSVNSSEAAIAAAAATFINNNIDDGDRTPKIQNSNDSNDPMASLLLANNLRTQEENPQKQAFQVSSNEEKVSNEQELGTEEEEMCTLKLVTNRNGRTKMVTFCTDANETSPLGHNLNSNSTNTTSTILTTFTMNNNMNENRKDNNNVSSISENTEKKPVLENGTSGDTNSSNSDGTTFTVTNAHQSNNNLQNLFYTPNGESSSSLAGAATSSSSSSSSSSSYPESSSLSSSSSTISTTSSSSVVFATTNTTATLRSSLAGSSGSNSNNTGTLLAAKNTSKLCSSSSQSSSSSSSSSASSKSNSNSHVQHSNHNNADGASGVTSGHYSDPSLSQPQQHPHLTLEVPYAVLTNKDNSCPFFERRIALLTPAKVGRAIARVRPSPDNAIFDCKVLSRNHALLMYQDGKFFLKDTHSSNGTFVNDFRLSSANEMSQPHELFSGDCVKFGVEVIEKKQVYSCIIATIQLFLPDGTEAKPIGPHHHLHHHHHLMSSDYRMDEYHQKGGMNGAGSGGSGQPGSYLNANVTITPSQLVELSFFIKDAIHKQCLLESQFDSMKEVMKDSMESAKHSWESLVEEDQLLNRIETLQAKLETMLLAGNKDASEEAKVDVLQQEMMLLISDKEKMEQSAKAAVQRAIESKTVTASKLQTTELELRAKELECQNLNTIIADNLKEMNNLVSNCDNAKKEIDELVGKLRNSKEEQLKLCLLFDRERAELQEKIVVLEHYEIEMRFKEQQRLSALGDSVNGTVPARLPAIQSEASSQTNLDGDLAASLDESNNNNNLDANKLMIQQKITSSHDNQEFQLLKEQYQQQTAQLEFYQTQSVELHLLLEKIQSQITQLKHTTVSKFILVHTLLNDKEATLRSVMQKFKLLTEMQRTKQRNTERKLAELRERVIPELEADNRLMDQLRAESANTVQLLNQEIEKLRDKLNVIHPVSVHPNLQLQPQLLQASPNSLAADLPEQSTKKNTATATTDLIEKVDKSTEMCPTIETIAQTTQTDSSSSSSSLSQVSSTTTASTTSTESTQTQTSFDSQPCHNKILELSNSMVSVVNSNSRLPTTQPTTTNLLKDLLQKIDSLTTIDNSSSSSEVRGSLDKTDDSNQTTTEQQPNTDDSSQIKNELIDKIDKFCETNRHIRQQNEQLANEIHSLRENYESLHFRNEMYSSMAIIPLLVIFVSIIAALHPIISRLTGTNEK